MRKTALLVDGTAQYLAAKIASPKGRFKYDAMLDILRAARKVSRFDLAIHFTSFHPSNDGQTSFLKYIGEWVMVDAVPVSEAVLATMTPMGSIGDSADASTHPAYIRFDARIAFCLGRLAGQYDFVIVSDSYALSAPALEAKNRGSEVLLAFFGQSLDPRWQRQFRDGQLTFLDFDEGQYQTHLFGLDSRAPQSKSGLSKLP